MLQSILRSCSRVVSTSSSSTSLTCASRRFNASNARNIAGLRYGRMPPRVVTAQEAALAIKSHQTVYVQMAGATPTRLLDAIVERHEELTDVKFVHMHVEGKGPHMNPAVSKSFRAINLFTGANARAAVNDNRADFVPIFLSDIPLLFRRKALPVDVALVHVSPPDKHGFVSLGVSVDATLAAIQSASVVIAQVNPNMPRTHGDGVLHINSMDAVVQVNDPLPERAQEAPSAVEARIGEYAASLVEDGATLQMGIGAIPDAVLRNLGDKKGLGIHTEMFSDGVLDLVDKGVITGEHKVEHPHKIVTTFLLGSRRLYDFVNDNPLVEMREVSYTNNAHIISKNPKVTAINSAIEVDLTGQVCADSIGGRIFSGVGGQMDFLRGAALSEGGKPIIALPSVTSKGVSRIVTSLKRNAGVTTTRAHVDYIVTEYGIARLWGKSIRERHDSLIGIAHPMHRDWLAAEVARKYWLDEDPWAKTQKSVSPSAPEPVVPVK